MALIRAFVALPLSLQAQRQLADFSSALQQDQLACHGPETHFAWVVPDNYHLTLAFVGNIRQRDIEVIHLACQSVAQQFNADNLTFTSVEWFPHALKPRLIVAVPEKNATLFALQKLLLKQLRREGIQLESRPFRPHISLVRVKAVEAPVDLAGYDLSISSELDELVLFKSEPGVGGSFYTPIFAEPIAARLFRQ